MDNPTLLGIGINALKSVSTENIETVDIDRTEHNDGTVTLSVSVTAPAKESGKGIIADGGKVFLNGNDIVTSLLNGTLPGGTVNQWEKTEPLQKQPVDERVSTSYCSVDSTRHIETNLKFTQNGRYLVIDLGEPTGEKKEVRIEHSIPFYGTYLTDKVD